MANQWRCRMNSVRSSAMSDVFIVLFISLPHFWFICKSDPRSHYLRVLALLVISPRPLQIFVKLEQCASYQGSRQILSRRQHAPNKWCALNNRCAPGWYQCTLCTKRSLYYKGLFYVNWSLYYMGLMYYYLCMGLPVIRSTSNALPVRY